MRSLIRRTRKGLVPFVVAVVVLALAAPAFGVPVAPDQGRHRGPVAEVKVSRDVRLGQFSEMRVRLWARCRSPWVVQELVIEVSQAGASGSFTSDFGIICDGTWHPISTGVTTPGGGPFARGLTTVTATLTVIDPVTGTPAPQGQDSVTVFVHSQAEVKISRNVRLGQGGAMLVSVWVRCERPWVEPDLIVEVSQDEGFIFGSAAGDFGIVCDDRLHRIDVKVFSSGELELGGGLTRVDAFFDVQDPIDFDPVDQATDSVTVWVRAPAEVRISWRGKLNEAGEASIVLLARCQAPWVIAVLSVKLTQGDDAGLGGSDDFGLECDGRWLRRVVKVVPSPGAFEPGTSRAEASLAILDFSTGDPVFTDRSAREVWLVGTVAPVLWDQTGSLGGARVSADVSDDTLDSQGADDFVVPAGHTWSITGVYAPGSNGSTHPPPFLVPGVNVFIYEDGGDEPGALITSYLNVPPTTAPDDLTIPLSPALMLQPGTYWISVQADLSSLGPGNGWLWAFRRDSTGGTSVWRNPGGGFGGGSEDWTPQQTPTPQDFEFDLRGTSTGSAGTVVDVVDAQLMEDGAAVQATASATCDPLVGDSFAALSLTIFQGEGNSPNYREGQGGVGIEGVNGLVCDGTPHSYSFTVRLTSFFLDKKFTPGEAGFEWFVAVCTRVDPETTVCSGAGGPTQGSIEIRP